jgi:transcriptional regulator with XRE-family HTH domain
MAKAKFSSAYDQFRALLISARNAAGLKQSELAKRLGRHQSYISKVEIGERRLDVVEFIELADAVGVDAIKILRKVKKAAGY